VKPIPVTALRFHIGDIEDPDFHALQEIHKWLDTEAGKWMMDHSNPPPEWHSANDALTYSIRYVIKCYLTPELYTFWKLKYE
jgi:hypothetical protein